MIWIVSVALVTLGLVFLAREADATEAIRAWIKRRADHGRRQGCRRRPLARFLDAMLDCAPCVAAWAGPVSIGLVWLVVYRLPGWASDALLLVVVAPVGSAGLLYLLTVLSPSQAVATLGRLLLVKKDGKKTPGSGKDG